MKKAILIDVTNQSVTETTIDHYTEIYDRIGNGCSCFCVPIQFDNGDALYSDDEGLLHEEMTGCFIMDDWDYPLVGNAVILGSDDEGESVSCQSITEDIRSRVKFYTKEVAEAWRNKVL
jgi:hypothetical protein